MENEVEAMKPKMQECKAALQSWAGAEEQRDGQSVSPTVQQPLELGEVALDAQSASVPDWPPASEREFHPLSPVSDTVAFAEHRD
jgi:hypothetical protein